MFTKLTAVALFACVVAACAAPPPHPKLATTFTATMNVSAQWPPGGPAPRSVEMVVYQSPSDSLLTVAKPVDNGMMMFAESACLNSGKDSLDWNPHHQTCDYSCKDNQLCGSTSHNSGCGCASVDIFAGVAAATYTGTCGSTDTTQWTLMFPTDDDDASEGHKHNGTMVYCFRGNTPLRVELSFKPDGSDLLGGAPGLRHLVADTVNDDDDDEPTQKPATVNYKVLHYDNSPIPSSTFKVPPYCSCKLPLV